MNLLFFIYKDQRFRGFPDQTIQIKILNIMRFMGLHNYTNNVMERFKFTTFKKVIFCAAIILAVIHFSVSAQAPLRRPISPSSPMWLIHIDTWNYPDPQKIIDLVPKDIRPYVVMNIGLSMSHDSDGRFIRSEYGYEIAKSWLRTCAENRMWAMVQPASGAYSVLPDNDMTIFEEFYQDYPNLIGFNYCEQSWGYGDIDPLATNWPDRMAHLAKLLELGDKHGGFLVVSWCGNQYVTDINPIAMQKRNPAFASACSNYTKNYILCEKYTFKSYQNDMESLCLGSYLSGYSGQYGIRYDDSGWSDAEGNNNENFSMATYGAPFLEHVMLTGQTVIDAPELIWRYCFRELSAGSTSDGYTTRRWGTYPQFDNVSVDLFRKVIDGTVRIPTRQEVIDRTKVVIIHDVNSGSNDAKYSSPETLFEGLYSMDGNYATNKSFFKKTGRYPTIPTVYTLNDEIANSFDVKVNRSAYSSRWPSISSKVTEFNNIFPQEYTGDLYAGRHENGWVTYNPYKTGQTASASIPFKYNTCDSMQLSFSQYTAGVIKEFSDHLTIYLSNYDNMISSELKTDIIKIHGSTSEPTITYSERGSHKISLVSKNWSNGVFTLTIKHNGSIDITVNCSGTSTGRLTQYQTANIVVPNSPPVYTGACQYEAETFDYKNITGIVKSGYEQNIRNYTGQGYLQFGTNSAASVRDSVTALNDGKYLLETRYTTTGGDVNTIDLYVNGSKVVTPSFTQTDLLSNWAVDSQFIDLNKGVNTIEFRANAVAAQTIYFDNIVIGSGDSIDVWLEAECGNMGSLWETSSDSNASNVKYVTIQAGNDSTGGAPVDSIGHIFYRFNASDSGNYTVWGRVIAPTPDDDAFWVKMDNGPWFAWNNITLSTSWTWVEINTFTLTKGDHTFALAYNEDGAQLDKILITKSNTIPSGKGGPATNCLTRNQSPIAYAGPDIVVTDSDDSGSETLTLNSTGSLDIDGSIYSYEWNAGDSLIATGANPSVDLAVGMHTITLKVTDNDGATDTDEVVITIFESGFEYSNTWLEAECAIVGINWDTKNDVEASNGYYVTAKSGIESISQAPSTIDGLISIPFSVNSNDSYSVFGRLNCPTYNNDSYWVKMDNGSFQNYNGLITSGWQWIKYNNYELTAGEHTLTIGYRENGAKLDKILVSNYPDLPAGLGSEASNSCQITGVNSIEKDNRYTLGQNYPNPFKTSTIIKYNLKRPGHVYLKIYNLYGQEIETLMEKYHVAGDYEIMWQAKGLLSGFYLYQLKVGEYFETKKLIIQK
jgi:hypothetical protein